jgi:hypothetical protein
MPRNVRVSNTNMAELVAQEGGISGTDEHACTLDLMGSPAEVRLGDYIAGFIVKSAVPAQHNDYPAVRFTLLDAEDFEVARLVVVRDLKEVGGGLEWTRVFSTRSGRRTRTSGWRSSTSTSTWTTSSSATQAT